MQQAKERKGKGISEYPVAQKSLPAHSFQEAAPLKREQSQEEVEIPQSGGLGPEKEKVGPRGPDRAGDPSVTIQSESFSQLLRAMGNVCARGG